MYYLNTPNLKHICCQLLYNINVEWWKILTYVAISTSKRDATSNKTEICNASIAFSEQNRGVKMSKIIFRWRQYPRMVRFTFCTWKFPRLSAKNALRARKFAFRDIIWVHLCTSPWLRINCSLIFLFLSRTCTVNFMVLKSFLVNIKFYVNALEFLSFLRQPWTDCS